MNNNFEQLNPLPVDINRESTENKIFFPKWKCFCCEDSGIVRSHLVRLVIPEFNWNRDKLPRCNNCDAFSNREVLNKFGIIDNRFSRKLCAELDKKCREDWAIFAKNQQCNVLAQKAQQAVIELAQSKSLRKRNRTEYENLAQQQKHEWTRENWDLDLKTEELESLAWDNEYAPNS